MADTSHVVLPAPREKARRWRPRLSLKIKTFLVVACAIAVTALCAEVLFVPSASSIPFFAWVRTVSIVLYGYSLPLSIVLLTMVALCVLVCADLALSHMIHARLAGLLYWSRGLRAGEFTRVPVLPQLANDEIGDLGEELGISAAHFLRLGDAAKGSKEEKSLFLTIAAHQLRTPLTALSWSIESLLNPEATEATKREVLPQLNTLLKRMQLVVNHILASAHIEEGKFGYVFALAPVVPIIEKLVGDFGSLANDKKITLSFEHPTEIPPVYIDPERISLALFDLIANALDYTPVGGSVTVALRSEKERIEVSVRDTGIGIAAKDVPNLFTKFYRGENARTVRPDGSGLGLYLVKNIINAHGSEIGVVSDEIKGGSRFTFYLRTKRP